MTINSRNKGKRGELEAVHALRAALPGCRVIRGQQRSGTECADVIGIDGLHIEVKRRRRIAALGFLEQARRDAQAGEVPVVLMRQDRGRWAVMLDIEDLVAFSGIVTHGNASRRSMLGAKDVPHE